MPTTYRELANNEFWIAQDMMPLVTKRIEKINKQAAKVKAPPVTLHYVDEKMEELKKGVTVKLHLIRVEGEAPKLAGWKFIGTVDNKDQKGMIKTVPGQDKLFPKLEKHVGKDFGKCEHCKEKRSRVATFLVQNDKGKIQQVGKSCLKDFLGGRDPKLAVQMFSWFSSLDDYLKELQEKSRDRDGGGYATLYIDNKHALAMGLSFATHMRYVSGASANEYGGSSTAQLVNSVLFVPPNDHYDSDEIKKARALYAQGDFRNHEEEAQKILDWFAKIPADVKKNNAFYHNVDVVVSQDNVARRNTGYLIGLIPSYRKAMQIQQQNKAKAGEPSKNEHFGSPGQKFVNVQVDVVRTQDVNGYYGTSQMVIMKDHHGRTFVWFNNSRTTDMQVGKKYVIKGTIKRHKEYNGLKQTELTRVKATEA